MGIWFDVLAAIAIASGIIAIVLKHPLKSLLSAGVQSAAVAWLLFLSGAQFVAIGFLIVMALLYAGTMQFYRALDAKTIVSRHRFSYGQVLGLLAAFLFSLVILLRLNETDSPLRVGWLLFSIGLVGMLFRRNALIVLLAVMMMLQAGVLVGFGQARLAGYVLENIWVVILMVAIAAQLIVGLNVVMGQLIQQGSPDVQRSHHYKN